MDLHVAKKGNSYISTDAHGHRKIVAAPDETCIYKSRKDAEDAISSMRSAGKRLKGWTAFPLTSKIMDEAGISDADSGLKQNTDGFCTNTPEQEKQTSRVAEDAAQFLRRLNEQAAAYRTEMSKINAEMTDIYHLVEWSDFPYGDWRVYAVYQMWRKRLRRRRKIKDEAARLEALGAAKIQLEKAVFAFQKMDERHYTPRRLAWLFAEMDVAMGSAGKKRKKPKKRHLQSAAKLASAIRRIKQKQPRI